MNFEQMARDAIEAWEAGEDGTPKGFREHLADAFRRVADAENEACEKITANHSFEARKRIAARRKNRSAT